VAAESVVADNESVPALAVVVVVEPLDDEPLADAAPPPP
jgi:hypothetical protein